MTTMMMNVVYAAVDDDDSVNDKRDVRIIRMTTMAGRYCTRVHSRADHKSTRSVHHGGRPGCAHWLTDRAPVCTAKPCIGVHDRCTIVHVLAVYNVAQVVHLSAQTRCT